MKELRVREEARAELLHETQYYEGKREGTGKRFRESVNASFALIVRFPSGGLIRHEPQPYPESGAREQARWLRRGRGDRAAGTSDSPAG